MKTNAPMPVRVSIGLLYTTLILHVLLAAYIFTRLGSKTNLIVVMAMAIQIAIPAIIIWMISLRKNWLRWLIVIILVIFVVGGVRDIFTLPTDIQITAMVLVAFLDTPIRLVVTVLLLLPITSRWFRCV